MENFEYKILFSDAKGFLGGKVDQTKLSDEMNKLGIEGWELVSSVSAN